MDKIMIGIQRDFCPALISEAAYIIIALFGTQ